MTGRHRRHRVWGGYGWILVLSVVWMALVLHLVEITRATPDIRGVDVPVTYVAGPTGPWGHPKTPVDATSWYVLDMSTGVGWGHNEHLPVYTASVMKIWYAQDARARGITDPMMEEMIRDSDNATAARVWGRLGKGASIQRAVATCGLEDVVPLPTSWSRNQLSAWDMAHLVGCISDPVVLGWMASVRGEGSFGLTTVEPRAFIKNGWMDWDGVFYVNCTGRYGDWAVAVTVAAPFIPGQWDQAFTDGRASCEKALGQIAL